MAPDTLYATAERERLRDLLVARRASAEECQTEGVPGRVPASVREPQQHRPTAYNEGVGWSLRASQHREPVRAPRRPRP